MNNKEREDTEGGSKTREPTAAYLLLPVFSQVNPALPLKILSREVPSAVPQFGHLGWGPKSGTFQLQSCFEL